MHGVFATEHTSSINKSINHRFQPGYTYMNHFYIHILKGVKCVKVKKKGKFFNGLDNLPLCYSILFFTQSEKHSFWSETCLKRFIPVSLICFI